MPVSVKHHPGFQACIWSQRHWANRSPTHHAVGPAGCLQYIIGRMNECSTPENGTMHRLRQAFERSLIGDRCALMRDGSLEQAFAWLARTMVKAHPPLCPELWLHLGRDFAVTWEHIEMALGQCGTQPPYWSIAWPGGQAIARYIFDHPELVAGRRVLDLGSGSGICAIAAAMAGATIVVANDIDPLAGIAIFANAHLNNVDLIFEFDDIIGRTLVQTDVLLASDLWYERHLAHRTTQWLRHARQNDIRVIVGDKRRRYFPHRDFQLLNDYVIQVSGAHEPDLTVRAGVWQMGSGVSS